MTKKKLKKKLTNVQLEYNKSLETEEYGFIEVKGIRKIKKIVKEKINE